MTELLHRALEAVRRLDPAEQNDIARAMLALAGADTSPVTLTDEEREAIARSRAAAARGEFATDSDVKRVLSKYG